MHGKYLIHCIIISLAPHLCVLFFWGVGGITPSNAVHLILHSGIIPDDLGVHGMSEIKSRWRFWKVCDGILITIVMLNSFGESFLLCFLEKYKRIYYGGMSLFLYPNNPFYFFFCLIQEMNAGPHTCKLLALMA